MRTVMAMTLVSVGAALDWSALWQGLTAIFGVAPAQEPKETLEQAVEDLTFRLRHPVQAALAEPLVTIRRKLDRRRQ